jgi:acetyl-CoA acetyltransferase
MPTKDAPASLYRTKEGTGLWEHRGKVAVAGIGQAPTMRRWDGVDLTQSVGALSIKAAQQALNDAGISRDEVDGVVTCPVGMGDVWAPRPYFAPPYDSEDGLTSLTADWLVKNMALKNVKFTAHGPSCINTALAAGIQAVGDGLCHTCIVLRGTGNLEGRYHQMDDKTFPGRAAFNGIWGWQLIPQIAFGFNQYCRKYGTNHDRMAPFILNQRRNGLLNPDGYHFNHRREVLTVEDYLAARWICKPMSLLDCDMPIQTAGAFLITTAERARHMKQKPVYILNHCSQRGVVRSSCETLEETEEFTDHIARMCYEGSGLSSKDIDIFNPYDGFTLFFQYFLEGFQWRGVKRGEAHDFYAGDISVEGPNPLSSSGGNCGNGRTRWWGQRDCIQQLRGQAGYRQVRTRHETAIAGAFTAGYSDWVVYSTNPD